MTKRKVYFDTVDKRGKRPAGKVTGVIAFLLLFAGVIALAYYAVGMGGNSSIVRFVDTPKAEAQEGKKKIKGKSLGDAMGGQTKAEAQKKAAEQAKKKAEAESKKDKIRDAKDQVVKDEVQYRETKIAQIQQDITNQLSELKQIQEALDKKLDKKKGAEMEEQHHQFARLVKIMSSMRGEEAAPIIAQMDDNLAVKILSSLSGRKASGIMGGLPPEKAAAISAKMVEFKADMKLKEVMQNWKDILEKKEKEKKP